MSSKVATVPENVLKKQTRDKKETEQKEKLRTERRVKNKERKALWTQKAQSYEKEYQKQSQDDEKNVRQSKQEDNSYFIPSAPKLALIVRIRGIKKVHPDVRKTLRLLKLRQLQNASFMKINGATLNMLKRVQAHVTYGGFGKLHGQRIPLTDNRIIEEGLGKFGITCIEDLIHEIYTVGPHFKQANNFLWTFKLDTPRGGFRAKRHPYQTIGDWGNREIYINDFVKRML